MAIAVPRAMASSDESDIDDTRAKAQSGGEVAEMAMNGRLRLRAPVPDPYRGKKTSRAERMRAEEDVRHV